MITKCIAYAFKALLIFFFFSIAIFSYKHVISVLLLVYFLHLSSYVFLLFKIFFFKKHCVMNAPCFYNGVDWTTLLINFLIVKPQANVFRALYLAIRRFKLRSTLKQKITKEHLRLISWLVASSFSGFSLFLLKTVLAGFKSLLSWDPTTCLFKSIDALVRSYDITDWRIVFDDEIWLNPHEKLKDLLKLVVDYKKFINDTNFKDATSHAKEHGLSYEINEATLFTQTSHGVSKAHKFIMGQHESKNEVILVRTHDQRYTIISKKINDQLQHFSQAQFCEDLTKFQQEPVLYKTDTAILQQIYSSVGLKLYFEPLNPGFLNIFNEPSKIIKIDNSFLQKDTNLIKMAAYISNLQHEYNVPVKLIEAIVNEVVFNNVDLVKISQLTEELDIFSA